DYTFAGTAGEVVTVQASGGTYGANCDVFMRLLDANGQLVGPGTSPCVGQATAGNTNDFIGETTVSTTGTYTVEVISITSGQVSGSVAINLYASPAASTIVVNGPAVTFSSTGGQGIDYTFTAPPGETVTAEASGGTFAGSCDVFMRLLDLNGNLLGAGQPCVGQASAGNPTDVTGVTTAAAEDTYTVQLVPNNGDAGSVTITLISGTPTLTAPSFTADSPPSTATVGTFYSYTFTASGNPAPTFSLASGTLPTGLTLNPTSGVLSGTPTVTGPFNFTVTAANGQTPNATTPSLTITVSPAPSGVAPSFTADSPPAAASVCSSYSYTFAASGTPTPTFAVASGTLPSGLTLNTTSGVLSGLPTLTGTYSFTISAANGVLPNTTTPSLTITVSAACTTGTTSLQGTVLLGPSSLSFGAVGVGSTSSLQIFTITNFNPAAALVVSGLSVPAPFHIAASSICPATLGFLQSCTVAIYFSPTSPGAISGALDISDDAGGSPQVQVVVLSGEGF
ncbi:MAG: putative Ig domain-containing protein, partial [Acidimicrobiales bacterium]